MDNSFVSSDGETANPVSSMMNNSCIRTTRGIRNPENKAARDMEARL